MACIKISLPQRFLPGNISPESIGREDFIANHVSKVRKHLSKATAAIDATSTCMHKSSKVIIFQSYSLNKPQHLLQLTVTVPSDDTFWLFWFIFFTLSKL